MIKWRMLIVFYSLLVGCENPSQSGDQSVSQARSEPKSDARTQPKDKSTKNSQRTLANSVLSNKRAIEDYKTARPLLWRLVYPNGGKTLYCGETFDSERRRGYNVEHVFPMSWATNGLSCGKRKQCRVRSKAFNLIEADLHNLFPSRADVNQDRSSHRFGNVDGESRRYGSHCDFEVNARDRVAEPAPGKRGEVARAMFYMADRYKSQGLVLFKRQALLLEKWHKADPPSDEERRRNNVIETIQGNRNPFIDTPDKAHRLIKLGHFFN